MADDFVDIGSYVEDELYRTEKLHKKNIYRQYPREAHQPVGHSLKTLAQR